MKNVFILLLLLFTSCARIKHRGFYLKDEDVVTLKVGLTSMENTLKTLGEPSFKMDDNNWLYYSYTTAKYGFLRPRIKEEKILLVEFADGTIANMNYNIHKKPKMSFEKDETKMKRRKESFFKELFRNVGVSPF